MDHLLAHMSKSYRFIRQFPAISSIFNPQAPAGKQTEIPDPGIMLAGHLSHSILHMPKKTSQTTQNKPQRAKFRPLGVYRYHRAFTAMQASTCSRDL